MAGTLAHLLLLKFSMAQCDIDSTALINYLDSFSIIFNSLVIKSVVYVLVGKEFKPSLVE